MIMEIETVRNIQELPKSVHKPLLGLITQFTVLCPLVIYKLRNPIFIYTLRTKQYTVFVMKSA